MKTILALAMLAAAMSAAPPPAATLLRPMQVFDGVDPRPHPGWDVLVEGDRHRNVAQIGYRGSMASRRDESERTA